MDIIREIAEKANDRQGRKTPNIAFLGDSVTQGCFEIYMTDETSIETVFGKNSAYHTYVVKILSVLFPGAPVNIINAGDFAEGKGHCRQNERYVFAGRNQFEF